MADAEWSDDTRFVPDATPAMGDYLMGISDPGGTPGNMKTTLTNLLGTFEAEGTALTDLPSAAGDMDADDTLYGEEDGTPSKFTRLQLVAGVPTGGGTPDTDDAILGLEDGAFVGFTRAQLSAAVEAVEAHLIKAFGAATQTIENAAGRRFAFRNDNGLGTNDIHFSCYLDNDDTQPVFDVGTVLGVVVGFSFGPGGSTAPDMSFNRIRAANPGISTPNASTNATLLGTPTGGTNITPIGNVGTGTDILRAFVIPAGMLATAGDKVVVTYAGTFANNANAKTLALQYNAVDAVSVTLPTSVAGSWKGIVEVTRIDGTNQDVVATMFYNDAVRQTNTTATATLSNNSTIRGRGTATDNDDIVSRTMSVLYIAAGQ